MYNGMMFIYRGLSTCCQLLVLSTILTDQVFKFIECIEPAPIVHKVSGYYYKSLYTRTKITEY